MKLNLNGCWKMKKTIDIEWIRGNVPGSVINDLLNAGKIEDPFYRDNEMVVLELAEYDYEYKRSFVIDSSLLNCDRVLLCCEGLDTLAEVCINNQNLAYTDNMHRTHEFDVKDILNEGENTIHITFFSPTKYIREKQENHPLWGVNAIDGFPHIRKAHYMLGWDWGPMIPDAGIWRDIYIKGQNRVVLDDVYITQNHEEDKVKLDIRVRLQYLDDGIKDLDVKITSPRGEQILKSIATACFENNIEVEIDNPMLWWPNGYGQQPLYKVEVLARDGDTVFDSKTLNIGLRTIRIKQEKDKWGESFEFEVNGVSIFARGANYIPEDNLLARCSRERSERLIQDSVEANFNCMRVWGGGIYPPDYFFDLCDHYGLIVWHDFMFACAVYDMSEEFKENIEKEIEDNVKRIRHHACLGLWCGNNENESAVAHWGIPQTPKTRRDYIHQYEVFLPQLVKHTDPNTFYWRSSPSSYGCFEDPGSENVGDGHYWDVWHGLKPFIDYKKYYFRFVSEFGFESFPCPKTTYLFTLLEDRNVFSYIMEKHQRHPGGNGKILYYLAEHYKYPKDFESLLYVSQILQAEAIRYGVEHWRRNRGRCMGTTYWQLNDCWPAASWASIDSAGRWKALHYFAKKFFSQVLLSLSEENDRVEIHVVNENVDAIKGSVTWNLVDDEYGVIKSGAKEVKVGALCATMCEKLDKGELLSGVRKIRKTYLEYSMVVEDKYMGVGVHLFVPNKHFEFTNPQLEIDVRENATEYTIHLRSKALAKYVILEIEGIDCVFSDNFFDVCPEKGSIIGLRKDRLPEGVGLKEIRRGMRVRSLIDLA